MAKHFWIALCLLASVSLQAANVTISGNANSYVGKEIAVYQYNDYFNKKLEILQNTIIANNGSFTFNLEIEESQPVFFRIGYVNASMYVQPDGNYDITFPALNDTVAKSINNTNRVDIIINKMPNNDINQLIADFNQRYFDFATKYQELITSRKFPFYVDTFAMQLDTAYLSINNNYFKTYVTYNIAQIKLNSPSSKKKLYQQYIFNKPILYKHEAYVGFIRSFFDNYLYRFDVNRGQEEVLSAVDFQQSYNALIITMLQDDFLKNIQLAELIILTGLNDLSKADYCTKKGIINIISLARELCRFPENKALAENFYNELTQFEKSFPAEGFTLYDKRNKLVSLSDFKGKYVYIGFWASWCSDCLRQMSVIKQYNELYGKDIAFVSISIDENIDDMKAFLKKHPDFDWPILYGGSDVFLKEKYGLITVPNYFLIDNEGKHYMPFTKSPGNGIEPYFSEIQRKLHPIMRLVPGGKN